jgi:hypothetical protein
MKMITAQKFENRITGRRRPRRGPSEIQTATREYAAVKAFPRVGYSFLRFKVCLANTLIQNAGTTYYLCNTVYGLFARFVMCL